MNKLDNTEPYYINKVVATWLSPEKDAAGIFIDFTINAGDTVTHEFKRSTEGPDTLIYYIKENPSDLTGVVDYTNCVYEPMNNEIEQVLNIQLVAVDIHGDKSVKTEREVIYTLGAYSNEGKEYEIDYVSAPFASYKENRSVYIIINMDLHEGDIVCSNNFKLESPNDQFTVNVISNEGGDKPSVPYVGIFGPFRTDNFGVALSTAVNGNVPVSSPVGIKSYGNDIHQRA
ncbi:MAG: hypothetical protein V4643_07605 [Bacteroidota bacterium]